MPGGIDPAQGLVDAVGAGGEGGVGEHGLAAGGTHGLGYRLLGTGDHHRPEGCLDGTAPDLDDHGLARDRQEGLVR